MINNGLRGIYYPGSERGFSFWFSFFFSAFSHKSPSGLYSACVTNACLRLTWKATSSDSMISRAMKSHTKEHTVRGRPTLKVAKRFRKGSVCKAYERSTNYLRANVLSEFIKNHVMPKELAINRGYRLFTLTKSIFRSVIVFLDVIVNQVGSQHELITSEKQEQKG